MTIVQNYYRVREHRLKCEVCGFSKDMRLNINRRLLRGDAHQSLIQFVNYRLPIYKDDDYMANKLEKDLVNHMLYFDWLLNDVISKKMYNIVDSNILEQLNNLDDLTIHNKTHLIMDIEDILDAEIPDIKVEKLSLLNAVTKTTLPLLMGKINRELEHGKSKDAKDMIVSLSSIINNINELDHAINTTNIVNTNDDKVDETKYIEENGKVEEDVGKNLISLSDRIKQVVNNK